jgi:hypothetical protein
MAFIEKLVATDQNVKNLAQHSRGETVELDEHEGKLLAAMSEKGVVHPLGSVILGRGIPEGEPIPKLGQPGRVEEDYDNPDGVWLQYMPL